MRTLCFNIKNSYVKVIPEVAPKSFYMFNGFDVNVICDPAFSGSDRELMNEVCHFLSTHEEGSVELKTLYVVHNIHFDSKNRIEEILFQVITRLEPQWCCQ